MCSCYFHPLVLQIRVQRDYAVFSNCMLEISHFYARKLQLSASSPDLLVCILQIRMHSLKETEEDSPEAIDLSEKATSSEDWQQLQSLASTFSGVT